MKKPREMLISTPAGKKFEHLPRAPECTDRAQTSTQCLDGLPVSTSSAFCLKALVRRNTFESSRKNDKHNSIPGIYMAVFFSHIPSFRHAYRHLHTGFYLPTTWFAPTGLHLPACTYWVAPTGLHLLGCTYWVAPTGSHLLGCTYWAAPTGLHLLGCTYRVAPTAVCKGPTLGAPLIAATT